MEINEKDLFGMTFRDKKMVEYLSNGLSLPDIESKMGVKRKTLEARVMRLRGMTKSKNIAHLCSQFLRKQIIK